MCFCVCAAGAGGVCWARDGNCCALLPSPNQILMGSRPPEAATICPPAAWLELASGPAKTAVSTADSRPMKTHRGLQSERRGGLFIKQVNHQKQLKMKKKDLVWSAFRRTARGGGGRIQPSGSPLQRWNRGLLSFFFPSPHFYVEGMAPSRASLAPGGSRPHSTAWPC